MSKIISLEDLRALKILPYNTPHPVRCNFYRREIDETKTMAAQVQELKDLGREVGQVYFLELSKVSPRPGLDGNWEIAPVEVPVILQERPGAKKYVMHDGKGSWE